MNTRGRFVSSGGSYSVDNLREFFHLVGPTEWILDEDLFSLARPAKWILDEDLFQQAGLTEWRLEDLFVLAGLAE
jgi:hypothetical protein